MTAAIYRRLAKRVPILIEKYGQTITLSTTDLTGAYTTRHGKALEDGIVDHALGDSGINIGDKKLLLDAGSNPVPGDRITMSDGSFVIVDPVKPIKPATTVLAFQCYARTG